MDLTSVAVFCGSSPGNEPHYREGATRLGHRLAERGIRVIYGGGTLGLMGTVANAALEAGGDVIGVMPKNLAEREVLHTGLTEFHIVPDMHVRKAMMAELADAFIALPGGIGTLEEITEQWTWSQLGIHQKPCAFLDESGFYAPLQQMVTAMVSAGFLTQHVADRVRVTRSVDEVLTFFETFSTEAD